MKIDFQNKIPVFISCILPDEESKDLANKCFESLRANTRECFLVVATALESEAEYLKKQADFVYCSFIKSQAWNEFLQIILDSDINYGIIACAANIFQPDCLEKLESKMMDERAQIVSIQSFSDKVDLGEISEQPIFNRINGSVFAINKLTIRKVGFFDYLVYAMDIDYWIRSLQFGVEIKTLKSTYVLHEGSKIVSKIIFNNKELIAQGYQRIKEKNIGKDVFGFYE